MKLSVILGITQMSFGILLKGANALYFREYVDFFFEFIPQLVFSTSLFVYMMVLIVWKWVIDWNSTLLQPPALINTLINIVLSPFAVEEPLYDGQLQVQQYLVIAAFASVPVMLLAKPIVLYYQNKWNTVQPVNHIEHQVDYENNNIPIAVPVSSGGGHGGHGEEFAIGEIAIHQGIETIEFVLGMVSNTASYLRLWALSLAHSELATVFWGKAMLSAINTGNPFAVFIGFALFAAVTTGVLLMMDVLECFLHALRLHWVEFQSKFYKADGHPFLPFSFKRLSQV